MKRKSLMILAAVLLLAVSIPLFSLAESVPEAQPLDGTGVGITETAAVDAQGNPVALDNCLVDENGYCYYLDENGNQQRVYGRAMNGRMMALRSENGAFCWSGADDDANGFQTRRDNSTGGCGCRRWN